MKRAKITRVLKLLSDEQAANKKIIAKLAASYLVYTAELKVRVQNYQPHFVRVCPPINQLYPNVSHLKE